MAIWDDRKSKIVAELGFPGIVRAIKLRRDLAVVALDSQVCVYDLRSLSQLASVDTALNAKGLCCLSDSAERFVLACPSTQQGSAQVLVYYPHSSPPSEALVAPIALETSTRVDAHERPLAAMAMNQRGTLLATCSEKGTTVHLYDARSGARLQSLRRGVDQADVHSLVFSPAGNWLAVTADKGTVHVFVVSECSNSPDRPENRKSSLRRLSGMLPAYFSSEWSFAQFRVPDNRFIAGYGTDEATLVVVSANGSYYKARFDPATGGEMEGVCHMSLDDAPVGSPAGIPKSQGNTNPSSFQLGDGAASFKGATPPHPSCRLKGAAAGG
jgi:WD40 repeat protein